MIFAKSKNRRDTGLHRIEGSKDIPELKASEEKNKTKALTTLFQPKDATKHLLKDLDIVTNAEKIDRLIELKKLEKKLEKKILCKKITFSTNHRRESTN